MTFSRALSVFSSKPRLDHPNPKKRLVAVGELPAGRQEELARVAREDTDAEVRIAAFERLSESHLIAEFVNDELFGDQAVARVIEGIKIDDPLLREDRVIVAYFKSVTSATPLLEMFAQTDDQIELARKFLTHVSASVQEELIESLHTPSHLKCFEEAAKQEGKQIAKLLHSRTAQLAELRNEKQEAIDELNGLLAAANKLQPSAPHYVATRAAHQRRYLGRIDDLADLNDRLQASQIDLLNLDHYRTAFPAEQTVQETQEETEQFQQVLNQFLASDQDIEAIESAESAWLDAREEARPERELSDRFYTEIHKARDRIRQQDTASKIDAQLARLDTLTEFDEKEPKDYWRRLTQAQRNLRRDFDLMDRLSDEIKRFGVPIEQQDAWAKRIAKERSRRLDLKHRYTNTIDSTVASAKDKLGKLEKLIADGKLAEALPIESAIRNLLDRLGGKPFEELQHQFSPFITQLNEYKEWLSFAAIPKREELCKEIEELGESPLEPMAQLEKIRGLRDRWKKLGAIRTRDEYKVAKRYNAAADKAYQVCREHFREIDQKRKENAKKREALCAEIESYIELNDWENPDWPAVIRTLQAAKSSYRQHTPVDRNAIRKIDKRFYSATKTIEKHLNAHTKERVDAKLALIEEAKALYADNQLQGNEIRSRVIDLQARWKKVGNARRRESELWNEFRELCDTLFQVGNREQQEKRDSIEANIAKASQLVSDLKSQIEAETDAGIRQKIKQFRAARNEIQKLVLPKRHRTNIDKQLVGVSNKLDSLEQEERNRNANLRLVELLELDVELAASEQADEMPPQEWFDAVKRDSVLFETRMPFDDPGPLRDLVLRAELLANIDPVSDEEVERRNELRIAFLKENIGLGDATKTDTPDALIKEWVGIAYGEHELRTRFNTAVRALL